ncbi:MAG: hypothetical protein ACPGES_00745 [Coraliomargarita sp.]
MFTCKQVSKTLLETDYENLSPMRKFLLRLHIRLCFFCGKFNKQVIDSQEMCRCYKEHDADCMDTRPKMDDEKKAVLKAMLEQQTKDWKA